MSRSPALNDGVPAVQTMLFPDPRPLVERLGADFFRQLPERPGVYLMQDAAGLVLYVGKAKNLRQRLTSYRVANPDRLGRQRSALSEAVPGVAEIFPGAAFIGAWGSSKPVLEAGRT